MRDSSIEVFKGECEVVRQGLFADEIMRGKSGELKKKKEERKNEIKGYPLYQSLKYCSSAALDQLENTRVHPNKQ